MNIVAEFVTSAARASDVPDDLPQIALVGRSNVGKSSLINALARRAIARTSAAPGKTRLANVYRLRRGAGDSIYLVDLPGYGYARRSGARGRPAQGGGEGREDERAAFGTLAAAAVAQAEAALLLVDTRHPGLDADRAAWAWLRGAGPAAAVVGTKLDKLARGERIRARRELESAFHDAVTPVSALTGEGLDELWKLIDRLAHSSSRARRSSSRSPAAPAETAPPRPARRPRRSSESTSRR